MRSLKEESSSLGVEFLVVCVMGSFAFAAQLSGIAVVLFPELAALSHDVLVRPEGEWANQPMALVLAPTLTAALGLLCTRHLPYGAASILLIVVASLVVIRLLSCSMSPAISAGVLPLLLNERSWWYPIAIFIDLLLLVLVLTVRKRYSRPESSRREDRSEHSQILDELEAVPRSRFWWAALLAVVLVLGAAAQFTGLRFLLFPPLIVMGYELLGHSHVPGWIKRPALLPVICLVTAGIGLIAKQAIHPSFLAVMVTVACSVIVLGIFDLRMPPALAIGVLPFVIRDPDYRYPLSVFLGTTALTLAYSGYRRLLGIYPTHVAEIP